MTSAIMTPIGVAVLKAREGVRLTAYLDTANPPVWTIGYGSTKGVRKGMVITMAEADARFANDLASHALPILSAIKVPVADHERDALISIAFNIGVGGFTRSTFLRRLNAGESRARVADAILMWDKPASIIGRRRAEAAQFLTPYSVRMPAQVHGSAPIRAPSVVPATALEPFEVIHATPAGPPPGFWARLGSWLKQKDAG